MERGLLLIIFIGSITFNAKSQSDIGKDLFEHLKDELLIFSGFDLLRENKEAKSFVANFKNENGSNGEYKKNYSVSVNKLLEYEIGEIKTKTSLFPVMFIKRKDDPDNPKIELLVINTKATPTDESSKLDNQRNTWMELCNAHRASELVSTVYTPDAYYYNRGRILQGAEAISNEYSYMNSPQYSLKLTPKHVVFVTSNIAYEIGRCSGSYPLPYMLLWKKQSDGNWQILMDSNY